MCLQPGLDWRPTFLHRVISQVTVKRILPFSDRQTGIGSSFAVKTLHSLPFHLEQTETFRCRPIMMVTGKLMRLSSDLLQIPGSYRVRQTVKQPLLSSEQPEISLWQLIMTETERLILRSFVKMEGIRNGGYRDRLPVCLQLYLEQLEIRQYLEITQE